MKYNIETFCDESSHANTYLVYDDSSCIIIDPANSVNTLFKYIGNKKVLGIFLTHGHYDHFRSLKEVLAKCDAFVYMQKDAKLKLLDPLSSCACYFGSLYPYEINDEKIKIISQDMIINLGNFKIKCLYTPGHTNCSMSFLIDNNLFSGDFLFKGTVGRVDLLTADAKKMQNSLNEIKKRKENFCIYPGHGSSTSLDDEKKQNPYLLKFNA